MERKDLIFLSYSRNECYPQVTDKPLDGQYLNPTDNEWMFEGKRFKINTEARRCDYGSRSGPIGVYDKSDVKNLQRMMHDWQEASRRPMTIHDD